VETFGVGFPCFCMWQCAGGAKCICGDEESCELNFHLTRNLIDRDVFGANECHYSVF
jgi:hypothetical protein